jgi:HEAT repeat protein
VADSYYWEAFARYRSGGSDDLRESRRLLAEQQSRYPKAATSGDAAALRTRVEGQLAQLGDAEAARRVSVAAESAAPSRNTEDCTEDEDDTRIAALNALLQIDADRAIPILKKVLARREKCSEVLRRKAVFLVSQKRTDETESILLDAARQDPDGEVREQAVFWLSQVGTERSVNALDSILQFSKDAELQKKAVFALSQTRVPRAQQVIRDLAGREGTDEEVREQAVFWLGQSHDAGNADFLRTLYGKTPNTELKEKILFSLSQIHSPASDSWLLDIAQNSKEDIELRKKALFWAGQSRASSADLIALYEKMKESEMREQLIFVYSQRREPAAVDKLMQIARSDPDKELKKKAIFWLSQSRDPRAAEFLLQVIEQP